MELSTRHSGGGLTPPLTHLESGWVGAGTASSKVGSGDGVRLVSNECRALMRPPGPKPSVGFMSTDPGRGSDAGDSTSRPSPFCCCPRGGFGRETNMLRQAANEDYSGLLLTALCPGIARRVYPFLANRTVETIINFIQVNATLLLLFVIVTSRVPVDVPYITFGLKEVAYAPFFLYITAIQRLVVTDLRALRLLLRQFEVWFVLINWALALACLFRGLFTSWPMNLMVGNLLLCGLHALLLDANRLPARNALVTTMSYGALYSLVSAFMIFQLMPMTAYDNAYFIKAVPVAPWFTGRLLTVALYYWRYTYRLWLWPQYYVVLRRPVTRRVNPRRRRGKKRPALNENSLGEAIEQGVDLESHKDNSCSSHEGDDDEEGGTGGSGGRDSPENFSGDKPEAALSGGGTLVGNLKAAEATRVKVTTQSPIAAMVESEQRMRFGQQAASGGAGGPPSRPPKMTLDQAVAAQEQEKKPQPRLMAWATEGNKTARNKVAPAVSPEETFPPRGMLDAAPPTNAPTTTGGSGGLTHDNYAWSPVDGYEGLLLHRLAPDLAVRAYPWLTHPKLELVINIITQVGSLVPTVALITAYVPKWTLLLAILLYIPALHRLTLIDLPVLKLLIRDFEMWMVILNWTMELVDIAVFGLLEPGIPTIGVFNLVFSNANALILDAVRLPLSIMQQTANANASSCVMAGALLLTHNLLYMDYEARLPFGAANLSAFHFARLAVLAVYSIKNAVRLKMRPDMYIVLHRPLPKTDKTSLMSRTLQHAARAMTSKKLQIHHSPDEEDDHRTAAGGGSAQAATTAGHQHK